MSALTYAHPAAADLLAIVPPHLVVADGRRRPAPGGGFRLATPHPSRRPRPDTGRCPPGGDGTYIGRLLARAGFHPRALAGPPGDPSASGSSPALSASTRASATPSASGPASASRSDSFSSIAPAMPKSGCAGPTVSSARPETRLGVDRRGWMRGGEVILATRLGDGRLLDARSLRAIALHEIGHAIGLAHSDDGHDVMAPLVRVAALSDDDRATARLCMPFPQGTFVRLAGHQVADRPIVDASATRNQLPAPRIPMKRSMNRFSPVAAARRPATRRQAQLAQSASARSDRSFASRTRC